MQRENLCIEELYWDCITEKKVKNTYKSNWKSCRINRERQFHLIVQSKFKRREWKNVVEPIFENMRRYLLYIYISRERDKICIYQNEELQYINAKKLNYLTRKWAKDFNSLFTKEDIQIANKHMKKFSIFVLIR